MNSSSLVGRCGIVFLVVGAMMTFGCSSEPLKFTINGQVTLDGVPVHDGSVIFSPSDGSNLVATGKVIDGNYELECIPGEKNVKIAGFTSENKVIPWTYVTDPTGLSASVNEDAQVNFELSSKMKRRR
ncbi:hypothetical protein [Bremerella alba]|uniref:Carboxypeptidase regulatory-like domain-containing protein n=1 Tax=Bremerella alba TaxID=980252 RepID=A0A7V8V6G0_9BACT|nr:hypothetical protein [Bremerella alba]MBA2115740.1 hypothetical protein [Bremerella alba]